MKKKVSIGVFIISFAVPLVCYSDDSFRLAKDLTPVGAERAESKSGRIPAWEGHSSNITWSYGQNRKQAFKYREDKPLYTVDASNVEKYSDIMTPGQQIMFKAYSTYKMPVYPSRRVCGVSDVVKSNTAKNLSVAKLSGDGNSLEQAVLPGVPFPIPQNGVQVMWNFLSRYQGVGVEYPSVLTMLAPKKGSDAWVEADVQQHLYFPYGRGAANSPRDNGGLLWANYANVKSPPALAGQALVSSVFSNNRDVDVYFYFPGQRRVRRMPTYSYDAPQIGFENQYTIDETLMFTGNLDRFDWKLIGKKEILVPYNSFDMVNASADRKAAFKNDFVSADFRRYEAHRVWVVEASVKAGARHSAPKKTFYIDEDSWLILAAEHYDADGKIWKYREATAFPAWELAGTCVSTAFVQYDVIQNRYLADFVTMGTGKDFQFFAESQDKRFKNSFFTSDNLRALSER